MVDATDETPKDRTKCPNCGNETDLKLDGEPDRQYQLGNSEPYATLTKWKCPKCEEEWTECQKNQNQST